MASEEKVKEYLAYWFQLGKKVLGKNNETISPKSVINGYVYSEEFEKSWKKIVSSGSNDYHLEGTSETIADLLSPTWNIVSCVRCDMPVPTIERGIKAPECPCHDLPLWPNTSLPQPRSPKDSQKHLNSIRKRLILNWQFNKH